MHARGPKVLARLLVGALIVSMAGAGGRGQAQADEGQDAPPDIPGIEAVTLVTGDRVWLETYPDGRQAVSIDPAPRDGAEPIFETLELDGEIHVVPSDAAPLVPEVLDPELFNLSILIGYGYTDGIPVILDDGVTVRPEARSADDGLTVTRDLPSIDAVAATVEPGGTWWRAVAPGAGSGARASGLDQAPALEGVEHVWLDEQVSPALSESVPIIGAPTAWDAGFDGTGMRVAVLDTGIDDQHPDLASQVVAAANFTDSDTARDRHGHGTHVAGIVAGTGAASDGTYTGVAPGAKLMNGKVLGDAGPGLESWVIAGMEWAAQGSADVINMSLGAEPTDGTDPVSLAVNQLTAEHDVLFVIAAGNRGSADSTVDTPGAADAALTVGSVNKAGFLAFTSGRGPRLGDFSVKPDITAPGVLITSARAEGSDIGTPVGDAYQQLSGTSMATPHVAGTAALLLQAHPELSPSEAKARLITTAVPNSIYDVYQQGGGRVDVPAAFDVPVLATPAPVNLGYFRYPQEDVEPVSTEVTYTNLTDAPVTLQLELDVESRDGAVPSPEMLSVTPSEVSVPVDGTSSVTVTLDVSAGVHGLYGGFLMARTGEEIVTRTPLGFYHEPEHYDLTITGIGRDGAPAAPPSSVDVLNVDDRRIFRAGSVDLVEGEATVRVPPGNYSVMGAVFTGEAGATRDWSMVGDPQLQVTADTSVVLDAREAVPITIETPEHSNARPIQHRWLDYRRVAEVGGSITHRYTAPVSAVPDGTHAVPTDPISLGTFSFHHRTRLGADEPATPYLYDLVLVEPNRIPADLNYRIETDELARIDNAFHSDLADHAGGEIRHFWTPGVVISSAEFEPLPMPAERVEFLVPGVARYQQSVFAEGIALGRMFEPVTEYAPGEQRDQTWHKGPRRPGLREGGPFDVSVVVSRLRDTLRMPLMEWADAQPSHWSPGDAEVDTTAFRLFQDGALIADGARPPATGVAVSPDPATFRLEFDVAREAEWWTTSTRTATAWTFNSSRPPGPSFEVEPLVMVDYEVDLDLRNTAPHPRNRSGPPVVTIVARHQAGADGSAIGGVRLWTSYDDGATWRERSGRQISDGRFEFLLDARDPIETSGFVSLRVEAWDVEDSRIEQEIIRAWRLAGR